MSTFSKQCPGQRQPCPSPYLCGPGCYFTEAEVSCPPCNHDCNQSDTCPARATKLVTSNGGNVIEDGKALPPKNRRLGFRICCLSAGAVIGFLVGFYLFFN